MNYISKDAEFFYLCFNTWQENFLYRMQLFSAVCLELRRWHVRIESSYLSVIHCDVTCVEPQALHSIKSCKNKSN